VTAKLAPSARRGVQIHGWGDGGLAIWAKARFAQRGSRDRAAPSRRGMGIATLDRAGASRRSRVKRALGVGCVNSVAHHKTFDLQARPSLRTPQAAEDEDVVEAVGANRAHPALGEGVFVRSLDRRADHLDAPVRKTSSKTWLNFTSRPCNRNRNGQRALYIKRLLLFEPHVILAGVPYRLD
jgi:hypothetical protein